MMDIATALFAIMTAILVDFAEYHLVDLVDSLYLDGRI